MFLSLVFSTQAFPVFHGWTKNARTKNSPLFRLERTIAMVVSAFSPLHSIDSLISFGEARPIFTTLILLGSSSLFFLVDTVLSELYNTKTIKTIMGMGLQPYPKSGFC